MIGTICQCDLIRERVTPFPFLLIIADTGISKVLLMKCNILYSYFWPSFFIVIALLIPLSLFAAEINGMDAHCSLFIGMDRIQYEEHIKTQHAESHVSINNIILGAAVEKRFGGLFFNLNGRITLLPGSDGENWKGYDGTILQSNRFKYIYTGVNGYIGLIFHPAFQIYAGLGWSEVQQERWDVPVVNDAIEKVEVYDLFAGTRGFIKLSPNWGLKYDFKSFQPFSLTITNNRLPGWNVKSRKGYDINMAGEIYRFFEPSYSIGLLIENRMIHRDGSDWESYPGGMAMWPENDTEQLSFALKLTRVF